MGHYLGVKNSGVTIRVSTVISAGAAEVWADVRHIASHVEWMQDAVSIEFEAGDGSQEGSSSNREGVGVSFRCLTKVGPVRLTDRMEVTEWVEGRVIGIRHRGLVTGSGRLGLTPMDHSHTEVVWEERLEFPARLGGPLGAGLARPILRRIWSRNLANLAARF